VVGKTGTGKDWLNSLALQLGTIVSTYRLSEISPSASVKVRVNTNKLPDRISLVFTSLNLSVGVVPNLSLLHPANMLIKNIENRIVYLIFVLYFSKLIIKN
jgi:hypothetical protein